MLPIPQSLEELTLAKMKDSHVKNKDYSSLSPGRRRSAVIADSLFPGRRRSSVIADPPSHFTVENSLSEELLKLSFRDRTAIEEEIHGVRCGAVDETPELIERSLIEFNSELIARNDGDPKNDLLRNVISISSFEPKNIAAAGSSTAPNSKCYLNNPDIRLRFLRCECFVVEKAVQRFLNFLEFSSELFGDFVAERPIRLSDFNTKQEITALQNSRVQYLPFRDRSGRRVIAGVGACGFDLDITLRSKIVMYLHWVASEDIETQRKGVVIIEWPFDERHKGTMWERSIRPTMKNQVRINIRKDYDSMTIRVASLHLCYSDTPFFRALSALFVYGLDSHHKSICKTHYGEPTEIRYTLSSFGIPVDLLPITDSGKVKSNNHSGLINLLAKVKQNNNDDDDEDDDEVFVECPRSNDVVFRKGGSIFKSNPGNMYYHELIESTNDKHSKADRKEKCQITWSIVKEIEERNGRFLEWSLRKELWIVVIDREKKRTKIASCLKQYQRKIVSRQKQHDDNGKTFSFCIQDKEQQVSQQEGSRLANAIDVAIAVVKEKKIQDDFLKEYSDDGRLKHYYSNANHSKRRMGTMFCGNVSNEDTGSHNSDDSIDSFFWKCFSII